MSFDRRKIRTCMRRRASSIELELVGGRPSDFFLLLSWSSQGGERWWDRGRRGRCMVAIQRN